MAAATAVILDGDDDVFMDDTEVGDFGGTAGLWQPDSPARLEEHILDLILHTAHRKNIWTWETAQIVARCERQGFRKEHVEACVRGCLNDGTFLRHVSEDVFIIPHVQAYTPRPPVPGSLAPDSPAHERPSGPRPGNSASRSEACPRTHHHTDENNNASTLDEATVPPTVSSGDTTDNNMDTNISGNGPACPTHDRERPGNHGRAHNDGYSESSLPQDVIRQVPPPNTESDQNTGVPRCSPCQSSGTDRELRVVLHRVASPSPRDLLGRVLGNVDTEADLVRAETSQIIPDEEVQRRVDSRQAELALTCGIPLNLDNRDVSSTPRPECGGPGEWIELNQINPTTSTTYLP